jgi:hypothetical protein
MPLSLATNFGPGSPEIARKTTGNCTRKPLFQRGLSVECDSDRQNYLFNEINLDATHSIYTQGVICPVSVKVGLPILMYRHLKENPLTMPCDAKLDNQRATFLMINPRSGFAPPK